MEKEINLREVIDKLRKGKWNIIGFTLIALLISFIYSFFIADPVYKGSATVTIHSIASVPEDVQPYINEMTKPEVFKQTLLSTALIEKLIKKEKLDEPIGQLQSKINIELPTEQEGEVNSFISITMEGTDKEKIKTIIDSAISLTKEELEINIQSRLSLLEKEYQLKMEEEDNQLTEVVNTFNAMEADEGLPALVLFQQNASDEQQYLIELNQDVLKELKDLDKTDQIKYEKLNKKIDNITSLYNFYSNKYDEIRSISTMNIVDISTNVLSDTFVPYDAISPNKKLNLAIAVILGLMVGVLFVFTKETIIKRTEKI